LGAPRLWRSYGKIHISGFLAWLAWLFVHIFFLIGFQNRVLVLIQWDGLISRTSAGRG